MLFISGDGLLLIHRKEFETKEALTTRIRKADPNGLRFDRNLHLTPSFLATYVNSYAPNLIYQGTSISSISFSFSRCCIGGD
jgi:hypothetical protein